MAGSCAPLQPKGRVIAVETLEDRGNGERKGKAGTGLDKVAGCIRHPDFARFRDRSDAGRLVHDGSEEIGVGLGAPDLMFKRRAQLNHPITMMHEGDYSTPIGIAIQDGNYVGATGADEHFGARRSDAGSNGAMVPMLHAFATDFLNVDYMFWVDQKPYFENQVMPCFNEE